MNYEFYDINMPSELMPYNMMNNNYSNNKLDLFNPYEGYLKGNAFKNEYVPYKNYKVMKPIISDEKEELLFNIGENCFMMHDLNLYLDVHPDDKEALEMFINYRDKVNDLTNKYERRYGPLCVKNVPGNIPFSWVNAKWPWVK